MDTHEIITRLECSGIRLSLNGGKLRVTGPPAALTEDVRADLRQHAPAIVGILTQRAEAPQDARTPEGDQVPGRHAERHARGTPHGNADEFAAWGADADVLTWFSQWQDRPAAPFELDQGRRVTDPVKFFQQLRRDVAAGPAGPRARNGALQDDIRTLWQRFGTN